MRFGLFVLLLASTAQAGQIVVDVPPTSIGRTASSVILDAITLQPIEYFGFTFIAADLPPTPDGYELYSLQFYLGGYLSNGAVDLPGWHGTLNGVAIAPTSIQPQLFDVPLAPFVEIDSDIPSVPGEFGGEFGVITFGRVFTNSGTPQEDCVRSGSSTDCQPPNQDYALAFRAIFTSVSEPTEISLLLLLLLLVLGPMLARSLTPLSPARSPCGIVFLGGSMRAMVCALLVVLSGPASAALISRLGGQAVYDSDINVTWLANANLAATQSFGVSGISDGTEDDGPAGRMHEQTALDWLDAMNAANYLGADDWRNARGNDRIGDFCFPLVFVQPACTGSEFGHMYYDVLGAKPAYMLPDGSVAASDERGDHPPFKNIQAVYLYSLDSGSPHGWVFLDGYHDDFSGRAYLWPVRDGDIGAVPEPRGLWLLGLLLVVVLYSARTR